MSEETLNLFSAFAIFSTLIGGLIVFSIYSFKALKYKQERDLIAIKALKSNVELKLSSKDLKEFLR